MTSSTWSPAIQCADLRSLSDSALSASGAGHHVSRLHRRSAWARLQQQYWNEVANKYDHLYDGHWSQMEDAWVELRLSFIANLAQPTIIDLGCGTGLGRRLIHQLNPRAEYVGMDISNSMARVATADNASVTVASMDDLSFFADASADVVLALFSSLSFAFEPGRVVNEIGRILRPSGYAYLSALSRGALSRLGRGGTKTGWYRTRGDRRPGAGTAAHFLDIDDMRRFGHVAGLSIVSAEGINAFSGVCEMPCIWPIGQLIAQIFPGSAHLIDVTFKKKDG
jgi:SAM-dependent methyltransferase